MSRIPWTCRRCLQQVGRLIDNPMQRRLASTATNSHDTISPILLSKARATANELDELSKKVAEQFDSNSAKRIGELKFVADALRDWDIANESLTELNGLLKDPSTDAELRELALGDISEATVQVVNATQSLTTALVPKHPFADMPCLIEIRPGVGGGEAALFAGDLLRMYQAYCAHRGLSAKLLKYEDAEGMSDPHGSDAPLQEAILEIENKGAYGTFRTEAGVHRVQRVPATESKGRTHTSAASVVVLPSLPTNENDMEAVLDFEDPTSDYYINPSEVRTDVMRSGGAGGQHVNKTESAVRLTHIPTNTVVAVQETRSQLQNRAKAWQILRAKLAQAKREAREEEIRKLRLSMGGGGGKTGRSDKVRTYNWGQQRVTDHRSGLTLNQLADVIEGGDSLDQVITSVQKWLQDQDIQGMLEDAAISTKHSSKNQK